VYTIELDKSMRDSGVQGGKIIGEKLSLGCFIIGIPLFIIGMYALFSMVFGFGFPMNTATILLVLFVIVIGVLSIIGGYSISRAKYVKK
jgi:hypothetical protein